MHHPAIDAPCCSLYTVFTRRLASTLTAPLGKYQRRPSPVRRAPHITKGREPMRSSWRTWLVSAIAVGTAAVGTGAAASGPAPAAAPAARPATPVQGAEITIALGSEPTSLDPHLVDDGGERAVNDNIYETLLTRTADGELTPGLATELPTQVDDTTWEFTLREGVTFHNGEPFNADSVVAPLIRMVGIGERGQTGDGCFGTLTGATAVDEHTVQITTDGPDGVLPARMTALKQIPASAEETPDLTEEPIGTG